MFLVAFQNFTQYVLNLAICMSTNSNDHQRSKTQLVKRKDTFRSRDVLRVACRRRQWLRVVGLNMVRVDVKVWTLVIALLT